MTLCTLASSILTLIKRQRGWNRETGKPPPPHFFCDIAYGSVWSQRQVSSIKISYLSARLLRFHCLQGHRKLVWGTQCHWLLGCRLPGYTTLLVVRMQMAACTIPTNDIVWADLNKMYCGAALVLKWFYIYSVKSSNCAQYFSTVKKTNTYIPIKHAWQPNKNMYTRMQNACMQ